MRLLAAGLSLVAVAPASGQDGSFTVTLVTPLHGKVQVTPPLPVDGKYAKGAVVTVTAVPDPEFMPTYFQKARPSSRCATR